MKLEKWALIAEIISALAIVLSLIFVGLQVRQGTEETAANSRALEATVRESMLNMDVSLFLAALPYEGFVPTGEPTTPEEIRKFGIYGAINHRSRENYWNQFSNGMLDEATYLSYREPFLQLLEDSDFYLSMWKADTQWLVPGFVAEINEELTRRGRLTVSE